MRIVSSFMLCFAAIILLSSCTNAENDKSDFAYYFVIDEAENGDGVTLYALMKEDVKSSDKDGKEPFAESYEGMSVAEAFSAFFEKHKGVYTGTVKEYAVKGKADGKTLEDFKVYLTNSPRLPARRKTVKISDSRKYIGEKLTEQSEKQQTKQHN